MESLTFSELITKLTDELIEYDMESVSEFAISILHIDVEFDTETNSFKVG